MTKGIGALLVTTSAVLMLTGCARERNEINVTSVDARATRALNMATEAKAVADRNEAMAKEALELARQAQADARLASDQARAANERADRSFQASLRK